MAPIEIRVPLAVSLFLIVLGVPAAGSLMCFGVAHLVGGQGADVVPALVLTIGGALILLTAAADLRSVLLRKRAVGDRD